MAGDIGPTFLTDGTRLAAVDWTFNGWGAQEWARWEHDAKIAREVAGLAGVRTYASELVNEGGGIHVDGEGTVLLTPTVQLGPERNPGWTREQVEAEIHAHLGTRKAIWLPRGLTAARGYGTLGHVDIVAAFAGTSMVVTTTSPTGTPDHEVTREAIGILKSATDARGRRLEVVEVAAPTVLEADGHWADYSYINHYVCNGGVVLCAFDDPRDDLAAEASSAVCTRGARSPWSTRVRSSRAAAASDSYHAAAARRSRTRGEQRWPVVGADRRRRGRTSSRPPWR
ncbi:Agmatine deiminase [Streptomyces fumanus]